MKNFLIKLLLLFRPKIKEQPHASQKFLIISTTGLGDTLWATPALRALRESHPHCQLDVLTSQLGNQVLKNNPHINQLFVISDSLLISLIPLLFKLKKQNYSAIFIFHSSQRLIFPFCALVGAPKIIGTKGLNKNLDFILTLALENKFQHEIERRLEMVRQVQAMVSDQTLQFFITKKDEEKRAEFLKSIDPSKLLIGLHPGAQNLFKQWDPERFIELGRKLKEKWNCQLIVTGNQKESSLAAAIASKIPDAISMAGNLSLSVFAALQRKMALFITNDTGPMHMAFAMKTPTIALFGPTDHRLCGPHQATNARIIQKNKTCTPCLMKKCDEPFCLLQIGIDEVMQKAVELINAP